jgi:hypothetical protein
MVLGHGIDHRSPALDQRVFLLVEHHELVLGERRGCGVAGARSPDPGLVLVAPHLLVAVPVPPSMK